MSLLNIIKLKNNLNIAEIKQILFATHFKKVFILNNCLKVIIRQVFLLRNISITTKLCMFNTTTQYPLRRRSIPPKLQIFFNKICFRRNFLFSLIECRGSPVGSILDYWSEDRAFDSHQRLLSVTLHRAHGRSYSALV